MSKPLERKSSLAVSISFNIQISYKDKHIYINYLFFFKKKRIEKKIL